MRNFCVKNIFLYKEMRGICVINMEYKLNSIQVN